MRNVTLRQLRYFEALADQGHFGRAAEISAVSQPALSVQIKELEQSLGLTLFERGARAVRLTPFGEEFAPRVREILRQVDALEDVARAARGRLTGRFRLGVIPTIAPYLLPQIIQALASSHPGLDLHVRETLTPRLVQELQQGRLDAAIVALPLGEAGFAEVSLFVENFVLVRHQADAGKPVPKADELRQMRLLTLEEGHCFRDQTLAYCNAPSTLPRDGLDGSSLATLVQMVGAGIGVTIIPEMAVAVEAQSGTVACAQLPKPQPHRTVGMIWRASSPLSADFTDVAEVIRAATTPDVASDAGR